MPDSGGALFQIEARGALAEVKWGNPTRVGVETRMCYPGSTMSKVSPASKPSAPRSRPGRTEKISVSLDRADVDSLRKRAKKLYGGNLSAAVAEGARRIREEEGREALVAWLGQAADTTPDEREAIRAEWGGKPTKRRRPRAA